MSHPATPGSPTPGSPTSGDGAPRAGAPYVLFVCTANICRSAYAEQLVRHRWPGLRVASAGTLGVPGRPVEDLMAAELVRRGATPLGFASRSFTWAMAEAADLVVTMEVAHRATVVQERPDLVWRTYTLSQLARVLREAPDLALRPADPGGWEPGELAATLRSRHRPPRAEHDVPDPYRRGPEVAASVATLLDDLLGVVVPRLV